MDLRLYAKLICVLHQFVNIFVFGGRIAFHSLTDNLDIAAAAAQDIT